MAMGLPLFLLLLPLFFSTTTTTTTGATSPPSGQLDPDQLAALHSLGFPTDSLDDPCHLPSDTTICDDSTPFRRLLSLRLSNCSPDLDLDVLPSFTLHSLSSLQSLSLDGCPSFHPLSTASFLSLFPNLTHLSIVSIPISSSSFNLSQLPSKLRCLAISNTNLSGPLPRRWGPLSLSLSRLDLSSNRLTGRIPSSISTLVQLHSLNLTSNSLSGCLPVSIGDLFLLQALSLSNNSLSGYLPTSMSALSELTHLDLSSNQLAGPVPCYLSQMAGLRHVDLEDNFFWGELPFNSAFVDRLRVLKLGGNDGLCFDDGLLAVSEKLKLAGIGRCRWWSRPCSMILIAVVFGGLVCFLGLVCENCFKGKRNVTDGGDCDHGSM